MKNEWNEEVRGRMGGIEEDLCSGEKAGKEWKLEGVRGPGWEDAGQGLALGLMVFMKSKPRGQLASRLGGMYAKI